MKIWVVQERPKGSDETGWHLASLHATEASAKTRAEKLRNEENEETGPWEYLVMPWHVHD